MKVSLKGISAVLGSFVDFDTELDLSGLRIGFDYPFPEPARLVGRITNHSGIFELKAELRITLCVSCARCLAEIVRELVFEYETVLASDVQNEENDGLYVYSGDAVDVEDVVLPAFVLGQEMVYLCDENCRGLCPECGCDLNKTQCVCGKKIPDGPFAGLLELFTYTDE